MYVVCRTEGNCKLYMRAANSWTDDKYASGLLSFPSESVANAMADMIKSRLKQRKIQGVEISIESRTPTWCDNIGFGAFASA